ncbi:MAG TPA: universal stress protein [Kofleriaceae bacterium]|jgi:nucleotide-binding universal stress UspA family protein
MWKKILCPVDFSSGSRSALREAIQLSKESGGQLVVIHVWAPPVLLASEPIGLPANQLAVLIADAETMLEEAVAEAREHGAPSVERVLRSGSAWNEIVEVAKDDPLIDLIVIGTHGRTGISRALVGSVAEQVVRHAPCPVLVMRERATK